MGWIAAQTDYIHLCTGHQQPLAAQGAPGALRRARRDARPLHQQPLRVGHRPRRRQPRDRQLQHPRQELHQGRVGRGRQGDPADVGAGRLLVRGRALHRAARRTTSSPSRTARVTRRSGWRAATRRPSTAPASSASAPSRSTSSRSSTSGAASTPTRKASRNCTEPIGQFKNDNVMITNSVICCETREEARKIALRKGRGYLVTMVNLYHDTMPKSQDAITWPSAPLSLQRPRRPATTTRCSTASSRAATCCCGTPDEVCRADRPLGRRRHGPARVRPADRGHAPRGDARRASSCSATRSSPSSTRTARTPPTATAPPRKPKYRARSTTRCPTGVEWPTVIPESALVQL